MDSQASPPASQRSADDRRRFRRFEPQGLGGTLAGRQSHPFTVITLSRGGLLVTMGFEPPLGQVFDLEIPLGEELFRSPTKVVFIGEDKAASRDCRYRVGLALAESSADSAILDRFIRERLEGSQPEPEPQ